MIAPLRQRWEEWRALLDAEALRAAYSPQHGLVVGAFLATFALVGAFAPAVRDILAVDAFRFGVAVAPAWLLSMALAIACHRGVARGSIALVVVTVGAAIVMYEAGSLVAFASDRAAPTLAGLVALTALAQAHQGLSCPRYPFVFAADVAGLAATLPHSPSPVHTTALLVGGSGGIIAGLLVGEATVRSLRARQHNEAMRSALEAGIAAQKADRARELEGLVLDARARRHDVRNALTSALLDLELLKQSLEKRDLPEAAHVRLVLDALETAVELAAQPARGTPQREPVALVNATTAVLHQVRLRRARLEIELDVVEDAPLVAHVEEGAVGLRRIIENLVVNAAEGDGTRGADHVTVRLRRGLGSPVAIIEVSDDGPGFSAAQLAAPIEGFATTKRSGSGLGLYTVQNLAQASGGWVERTNASTGGAVVTVSLPAEMTAPTTRAPS